MSREDVARVSAEALLDFAVRVLGAVMVPPEYARISAGTMVQATLMGESSHGIRTLHTWVRRIQKGGMVPDAPPLVVKDGPSTALLDGQDGIGQPAAARAMEIAIEKARETGVGIVNVRNNNFYLAAKYYPMMALEHQMIGFTIAVGHPWAPAPGGLTPKVSSSPISIAVPAKEEFPVVLDMATTVVARERIYEAANKGETIPLGWAMDKYGTPTDDPLKVVTDMETGNSEGMGLLETIGGYKGYGLGVMFALLTQVLGGGAFGDSVGGGWPLDKPTRSSHMLGAINIEHFSPYAEFVRRVDTYVRWVRDSKLASGVKRVYLPGEQGFLQAQERRKNGILLDQVTMEKLEQIAIELGVQVPWVA